MSESKHSPITASDLAKWKDLVLSLVGEVESLHEKNERLQAEVDLWKDRYEAERADHEASIKSFDAELREMTNYGW